MIKNIHEAISALNHIGGYFINDPSTPDLSSDMDMPMDGILKFSVDGMRTPPSNAHERRAVNCHMVVGNCLNKLQEKSKTPVKEWAGTSCLSVNPVAGKDMNAYYDRRSLKFFYHPYRGRNVYFSDSSDIVAHELGHAFLDAMRPDFWSVQSLEIWSFHEAFSDIVAMFNLMNHEKAVVSVLNETGGDLRRSNVASRLAEEVGAMIRGVTGDPSYLPDALRDPAKERFTYVDPSGLPSEASNDLLASECHSFGRVLSAAWYELFVRLFEMHSQGMEAVAAFKKSRDCAFSILMNAIPSSPRVEKYYRSIAKSMILAAGAKDERYGKIASSVFSEWGILTASELRLQETSALRFKIISQLSRNDSVVKSAGITAVCMRSRDFVKIGDLPIVSSLSLSPETRVELPSDSYYEFDSAGNLIEMVMPDPDAMKRAAAECLSAMTGQIGPGKMWDVRGGVLKRQYIV